MENISLFWRSKSSARDSRRRASATRSRLLIAVYPTAGMHRELSYGIHIILPPERMSSPKGKMGVKHFSFAHQGSSPKRVFPNTTLHYSERKISCSSEEAKVSSDIHPMSITLSASSPRAQNWIQSRNRDCFCKSILFLRSEAQKRANATGRTPPKQSFTEQQLERVRLSTLSPASTHSNSPEIGTRISQSPIDLKWVARCAIRKLRALETEEQTREFRRPHKLSLHLTQCKLAGSPQTKKRKYTEPDRQFAEKISRLAVDKIEGFEEGKQL